MKKEEYIKILEDAKKSFDNRTEKEKNEFFLLLIEYTEAAEYSRYYNIAIQYYEFLLKKVREINNEWTEAALLNNMSETYKNLGRRDLALDALLKSLELRKKVGDVYGEYITNLNIKMLKSGK
jgi:tetratricopeptide (TPR) repeat protein